MNIDPIPLSSALGAEINGIRLGGDLDPSIVAAIRDAWHAHQVLIFRDQALSQEDQLGFTRLLGEIGIPRNAEIEHGPDGETILPGIMLVTNLRREDGGAYGQPHEGRMWFHSDMCYAETPHKATLLYAVDLPSTGGETCFADMYAAWDGLPAEIRQRLDGATALQVHEYRRVERPEPRDDMSGIPHFSHPVAITHPETGRRALFVNRLMTARIDGLPPGESDEMLDYLFDRSEQADNVYTHEWRPGDLVMWDNRCTIHGRRDFPNEERRLLRRTTVVGERPS